MLIYLFIFKLLILKILFLIGVQKDARGWKHNLKKT